jgi:hypothetical protein
MSNRPRSQTGPPMTLGNMRANGARSLAVSCHLCHHEAVLSADSWPDDVPVPTFGPRMVCTRCGIVGAAQGRTGGRATGAGDADGGAMAVIGRSGADGAARRD